MRITETKIIREVRFIGHLWQGRVGASSVDFPGGRQADWSRKAVLEWLKRGKKVGGELTPSGDFQDIIDFWCDFSEGEDEEAKDWKSPWEMDESAETWSRCFFPDF